MLPTEYPKVTSLTVTDDALHIVFANGDEGDFPLNYLWTAPFYQMLKDRDYQKQAKLIGSTVCWPNGEDISPFYLHDVVTKRGAPITASEEPIMPIISFFYGIIIRMVPYDSRQHHAAHFHAKYAEHEAVFSIPEAELLAGSFPNNKRKLVVAWADIHREELLANWELTEAGLQPREIQRLQ